MWEPVGPLPASVYWRRRAVAVAVVTGALLGGLLAAPPGGADPPVPEAAGPEPAEQLVAAPAPPGVPDCTDDMIAVAAEIDRPEHRIGQRAVLRLVVTNVGAQPCVRDLDAGRQEVLVVGADLQARVWSSNDCDNPSAADRRELQPNQPLGFRVPWTGRTTTPGCAEQPAPVPEGTYQVVTRLDQVYSEPVPFRRLP
ncbi:MAG: hypothetical protein ACT4RN_01465 [Pseudonocardia sp.]